MNVTERFLQYVPFDTQSAPGSDTYPSTLKQLELARFLFEEMKALGFSDVRLDERCYVYAAIPANTQKKVPTVAFVAHMDTSPDAPGKDVKWRIVKNYDGGRLLLNEEQNISMGPEEFPSLLDYVGDDLIVTDGTTLLGADNKAGIAEIVTAGKYLLDHPEIEHGAVKIAFTPDEEVGGGTTYFDVKGLGADFGYTVDGGELGGLEYENFNGAAGSVTIRGRNVHPGSAKGLMKSAALIAMEFQSMLPALEIPAGTEGYEGFFHLNNLTATVDSAAMKYIIRDHDRQKFEQKKALFAAVGEFLNQKYGEGTVQVEIRDGYQNMREMIEPHMYIIDIAREAMEQVGVTPKITPIRGGSDGARLSYMGLPCPNFFAGGLNFHGRFEYVPIRAMEKAVEVIVAIAQKLCERA